MITFDFTCERARSLYEKAGVYAKPGVLKRATVGSAGLDLVCCHTADFVLRDRRTHKIPLGIRVAIPYGYVGILAVRSSTWPRYGVQIPNGIGVIDSDYRGEIHGLLYHPTPAYEEPLNTISPGDRLFQLLVMPVAMMGFERVTEIDTTERNAGGFGSTDRWRDGKERR